jgi:spore germination protein PE
MNRVSVVGNIRVNAVIFDSTIQVGDSRYIDANVYIFALQRERPEYQENEQPLENFSIYRREVPQLSLAENLHMYRKNTVPTITVGSISIKSLASSGILHAGSTSCIDLKSRTKHVRQFLSTSTGQNGAQGASAAPPSAPA